MENAARSPNEPFILVVMEFRQVEVIESAKAYPAWFVGRIILDSIDAPVAAVPLLAIGIMTVLLIVPIDDINGAVRTVLQIDRDIFRIAAEELIPLGMNDLTILVPLVGILLFLSAWPASISDRVSDGTARRLTAAGASAQQWVKPIVMYVSKSP